MFSRLTLALLLSAACAPLFAFFATPDGYSLGEYVQTSGVSGVAWDTAGNDFYAQHDGGLRRFDTGTNSFSSTLFFPTPGGRYFDHLAIDPANPDDFYVSYSSGTNSEITRLTRTGPDSATVAASFDYAAPAYYIFRMVFAPDLPSVPASLRGELLIAATDAATFSAGIYLVDRTTLALTHLVDVGTFNGNGPLAFDSLGNLFAVIPPMFGSFSGTVVRRFEAIDVAGAITGSPVVPSQGTDIIQATAGVWNITAMTGRNEAGQDYLYFSTYEHASIYRLNLHTLEYREFMQGFGGVADGWTHFAQGGSIAFSSPADDFRPGSGGAVRLAVPFSVYTPGFGTYASVFVIDPAAVSTNVVQLVVSSQPAAVNSGVPFNIEVDALDGIGAPANADVGVVASVSGAGDLTGFTIIAGPDSELDFHGLIYTGGTLPETITLTFEVTGNAAISVTTASIQVVAPAASVVVTSTPASVSSSRFFSATTEIRDGTGAVVAQGGDSTREVSVAVLSGPGSLWGQTSVPAVAGVAVFDSLIFDAPGSYVIEFTSPGLTPATSALTVAAASAGGGNGDDSDSSGCAAGAGGSSWLALLGVLAIAGGVLRLRGVAGR